MFNKYINTILTVIAVCLVLIVIELATLIPANAQRNVIDVNIRQVGSSTVFRNLPVEVR